MRIRRISVLIIVLALVLSGCGTKLGESLSLQDAIMPDTAGNDISSAEYKLVTENDRLALWFNENTTAFKVIDKRNGYEWYSTESAQQKATSTDAPFSIAFVNESGLIETMDAMTDSIAKGQYVFEKTEKGIDVVYSLGEFTTELRVPLALSIERKKFIADSIEDDFVESQFDIMYQLTDIEKLDENNKEKFLKTYPKLSEGPIYILRDSITASDNKMKELSKILADVGYTDEMYAEDMQYFQKDDREEEKELPQFRIMLSYELTEDALKVSVPYDEIQMSNSYPLVEIELLKSFGSPSRSESGYFLLPDGSGSLMNFYNGRGDLQNYSVSIYGNDKSIDETENIYQCDQAYFPVFGIKKGDNAVLTVIEEGDAIAVINAYPGSDQLQGYAAATFKLRCHYRSYTGTDNTSSNYFVSLQNERYKGDIQLSYTFLSGNEADYKGMANTYREKLFGSSSEKTAASSGILVECIGMIDKEESILGISRKRNIVMTDFTSVEVIAKELQNIGFQNINIKLSGWANGAYYGRYAAKLSVNKELGGLQGFKLLADSLKTDNIGFYPDIDMQYTYRTAAFDKFSASDIATLISKSKGYAVEYNPSTLVRDPEYKTPAYINTPLSVKNAFDSFFKEYTDFGLSSVSLRSIGRDLNADYDDKNGTDRETAKNMLCESLGQVSQSYGVMTSGINAYVLPYVKYCSDVPLTSNNWDNTDMSVPFVQMVISGTVNYSGPALNLEGDANGAILEMAAVGADAYYIVSAENYTETADSDYDFLYSSDFYYLKEGMSDLVLKYQKDMQNVTGQRITDYEQLGERLYRTTFENGTTVTVNYDSKVAVCDGIQYAAKSYTVKEKEEDL